MRPHGVRRGSLLTKLSLLLLAVGTLLAGAAFAWTKFRPDGEPPHEEEMQAAELELQTFSLGEFLVNLRTDDGTLRYLQTDISVLALPPAHEPQQEGQSAAPGHSSAGEDEPEPRLDPSSHRLARDVAIEVLSSQSFEALRDTTDRAALKRLLAQRLDETLEDYTVEDVLFTAFVMQ
ncbi:MAG: flagellar basal body-associated FliL family protein [Armatimonadota bacterium]|nr:flagellar basal body-associated FliL family protein [Armatimonadota bacterium]